MNNNKKLLLRGCQIRLYPTKEQEEQFKQKVDAARFVWNWGLSEQMRRYENGEKHLGNYALRDLLRNLKNNDEGFKWLDVYCATIQVQPLFDLNKAYSDFFDYRKNKGKAYSDKQIARAKRQNRELTHYDLLKHPKFKSKYGSKESFPIRYDRTIFRNNQVSVEGIGRVDYKSDRDLSMIKELSNPRISKKGNKWILSFAVEFSGEKPVLSENYMGIDAGIKDLATVCTSIDGINTFIEVYPKQDLNREEKRLKELKRRASRCEKGSKREERAKARIKKQYRKIRNKRTDYLHRVSFKVANKLPQVVCIEDLGVAEMLQNPFIAKALQDSSLSKLLKQIEYKANQKGIKVIKANRYFASSKTCNVCGEKNEELSLKDRKWKCKCGAQHQRDENASINLMRYGRSYLD